MKRIHFDVEEDGFYGAYWACSDTLGHAYSSGHGFD